MIKYLLFFIASVAFSPISAQAAQIMNDDGSFQIAATLKLGRTGASSDNINSSILNRSNIVKPNAGGTAGVDKKGNCAKGYYKSGATCRKCPKGTYMNTDNNTATECTPCAAGHYASSTGSATCTACPAGQYAAGTGNTKCTPCMAGTYAKNTGSSACLPCEPGKYNNEEGQSDCTACSAGTYAAGYGNRGCTSCGSGWITYQDGMSKCSDCSRGTYSTYAKTQNKYCEKCPAGEYTGSTGSGACIACMAGTYCPEITGRNVGVGSPNGQGNYEAPSQGFSPRRRPAS